MKNNIILLVFLLLVQPVIALSGQQIEQYINPEDLEIGKSYASSKQIPLMPHHSPANPIAAIQLIKQIPPGVGFKVLEIYYKMPANPWYRVMGGKIGTGWVNSTALYRGKLTMIK